MENKLLTAIQTKSGLTFTAEELTTLTAIFDKLEPLKAKLGAALDTVYSKLIVKLTAEGKAALANDPSYETGLKADIADAKVEAGEDTPVDTSSLTAAIKEAAQAEYELGKITDQNSVEYLEQKIVSTKAANAAIALGAEQEVALSKAEVEGMIADEVKAIEAVNAATDLLETIQSLGDAKASVADFLANVDTAIVDPEASPGENGVSGVKDTSVSTADVAAVYSAAVAAYNTAIGSSFDVTAETSTAEIIQAQYDAAYATKNAKLITDKAALKAAETEINKVAGLAKAIAALKPIAATEAAAVKAATVASAKLAGAVANFDALNTSTSATATATAAVAGGYDSLIVLDTAGTLVLADGVTEATNPGVTELLNASKGNQSAIKAKSVADDALLAAKVAIVELDTATATVASAATTLTGAIKSTSATVATAKEARTAIDAELVALNADIATMTTLEAYEEWETDIATTKAAIVVKVSAAAAATTGDSIADDLAGVLTLTTADSETVVLTEVNAGVIRVKAEGTTYLSANPTVAVEINKYIAFANKANELNVDTYADVAAAETALTDFETAVDTYEAAIIDEDGPLVVALETAQKAIFDDRGTEATADDTGSQVELDALVASKAAYEAVAPIKAELDTLEAAVADLEDKLLGSKDLVDGLGNNATADEDIFFIDSLVGGNKATITGFGAEDFIYVGTGYTVNTDLTAGDNSVLELFITKGATANDTLLTFETKVFGSDSTNDKFTVELTGVTSSDVGIVDGLLTIA